MDPAKVNTEVFFLPGRRLLREGREHHQLRPLGPVALQGGEAAGRIACPIRRSMNELYFRVRRTLRERRGRLPRADPQAQPGITASRCSTARSRSSTSTPWPRRSTAISWRTRRSRGPSTRRATLVPSFAFLQDDGSTSSGNWLYCNSYTEKGNNMARRSHKDPSGIGLYPEWSWCWPVNRRIIYNRASVDANGRPWDPKRTGHLVDRQRLERGCARRRLAASVPGQGPKNRSSCSPTVSPRSSAPA